MLQKGLKPIILPLKELSDEDQEYIKEQTSGKGGVKKPSVAKDDSDSAEASASSSTPAQKSKNPKTTAEPNPFVTDDEKPADDSSNKEEPKPKAEKADIPKITAGGGFDERTWTDKKGNKLTANFARLEGKVVVLLKNGQENRYPLDEFSHNDKLYIRQAALDLQKYQKFTGNIENADPQGGMTGPAMPTMPGMHIPPPANPGQTANAMIEAMKQQALARQQQMEEHQRQIAAEIEQRRQQAAEAQRQHEAQLQAADATWKAEIEKRKAEQKRLMEESRQRAEESRQRIEQQVDLMPTTPSIPSQCSVAANENASSIADDPSFLVKVIVGGGFLLLLVALLVGLIIKIIFGQVPRDEKERDLNQMEIGMCMIIPGFLVIAALLWMLQGYHKGKKALYISGGMMLLRLIIAAIILNSK